MKTCILISDSFKGSLSSRAICAIGREVFGALAPQWHLITLPIADGGEGTVDCFLEVLGAREVHLTVSGPTGAPVEATYARLGDTAIIEMAAAAGLPLAGPQPNPEETTTCGVGQLMAHALDTGCREILLGLGGSATNDGGCGCAAALGAKFYDEAGVPFCPVGGTLSRIAGIDLSHLHPALSGTALRMMCDVDNPLLGPRGAAAVFAPQKGADPAMVARLELGLQHLASCIRRDLGLDVAELAGAGAAGGMGAGCMAFLGGQLTPGIDGLLEATGFDSRLQQADLVITGEGRIDHQSLHGKVLSGLARRCKAQKVPLVAIAGSIGPGAEALYEAGITAMFGLDRGAQGAEYCKVHAADLYRAVLTDLLRLVR